VAGEGEELDILPFNHCAPVHVEARLIDVGYATSGELRRAGGAIARSIALLDLAFEPFTPPEHIGKRLKALAGAGATAAIVIEKKSGRRMEYHSGADWRLPGYQPGFLPNVVTSREHGALLRRRAASGASVRLSVDSRLFQGTGTNTIADLPGSQWPDEMLILGGHHDTVMDAPGGNDNGSGTIVVMELVRVLTRLGDELGIRPGWTIRFAAWSAEEQVLQGSYAHVAAQWPAEWKGVLSRLAINLVELSTATLKGLVLTFPHLRQFVQGHLDAIGDGYRCHVMAQLDPSSDHFPFARRGIDAAMCWRWRFAERHPDGEFHHEPGDTADKARPRELQEYVSFLARLLLRLSMSPPEDWPDKPVTPALVEERLGREMADMVRTG
jgi:hypothetical protein